MMKIDLQVLASTAIKRRKPWPRFGWIGKEKRSLFLFGTNRISILYIPSGKTKRKVPKIHILVKDCATFNHTSNGHFLVGLLSDGNIFVWEKDRNHLTSISGVPELCAEFRKANKRSTKIFASNDARHILIVTESLSSAIVIYLWTSSESEPIDGSGLWRRVETSDENVSPLHPAVSSRDLVSDCGFMSDKAAGNGLVCAFAYTANSTTIRVAVLNVSWFPTISLCYDNQEPVYFWKNIGLPLAKVSPAPDASFAKRNSLVLKWSRGGELLALAVNQSNKDAVNRVVFISSSAATVLIAALPKEPGTSRRNGWVCDMSWTHDDTFLVTINRLGSICLLSRLGGPMIISSSGCSMDLPPSLSLNVHPLVFVRWPENNCPETDTSHTTLDVLKQRFSVCCHPYLPIFLCSDGYMVTILQLPRTLADALGLSRSCLRHTIRYLKAAKTLMGQPNFTLDLATLDSSIKRTLPLPKGIGWHNTTRAEPTIMSWEAAPPDDESPSHASECDDSSRLLSDHLIHHLSVVGDRDSGTLHFGSHAMATDHPGYDITLGMLGSSISGEVAAQMKQEVTAGLLRVWGLCSSTLGVWTAEWDSVARKTIKVLLAYSRTVAEANMLTTSSCTDQFTETVNIAAAWMKICRFDFVRKHTLALSLCAIRGIFALLVGKMADDRVTFDSKIACAEQMTLCLTGVRDAASKTFGWRQSDLVFCSPDLQRGSHFVHRYVSGEAANNKRPSQSTIAKRFHGTWRRLYQFVVSLFRTAETASERRQAIRLLGDTQKDLQRHGISLRGWTRGVHSRYKAERLLLDSPENLDCAVALWKDEAKTLVQSDRQGDGRPLRRVLHAILYALLTKYRLSECIKYLYWLFSGDCGEPQMCLRNLSILSVVRSFARFLASHLTNRPAFLYPFHRPGHQLRSPAGSERLVASRIVLDPRKVVCSIHQQDVDQHFHQNVATALFLLVGATEEAAELACRLGDWKTSFILWMAHQKSCASITLPVNLEVMLCERWWGSKSNSRSKSIGRSADDHYAAESVSVTGIETGPDSLLLVAALCNLKLVTLLLRHLLLELKTRTSCLPLIVPEDVYLPFPPPYCPQPNERSLRRSPSSSEGHRRLRISETVQLFARVLRSSHCSAPVAGSYLLNLRETFVTKCRLLTSDKEKVSRHVTSWALQDIFEALFAYGGGSAQDAAEEEQLLELKELFRDLCTMLWFLNVRDKMNRHLRKFKECLRSADFTAWQYCQDALQWALHLIPFSRFAGWHLECYELILSILLEAPANQRSSAVLAYCFPDMTCIPAELDYRVVHLLNRWRTTVVKVRDSRGRKVSARSLTAIHLEQCQKVRSHLEQFNLGFGKFESDIFSGKSTNDSLSACRPPLRRFEIESNYFEFLGLVLDVGILRDLLSNPGGADRPTPLLPAYQKRLAAQYLAANTAGINSASPASMQTLHAVMSEAKVAQQGIADGSARQMKLIRGGLFRSTSMESISKKRSNQKMLMTTQSLMASTIVARKPIVRALSLPMLDQRSDSQIGESGVSRNVARSFSLLKLCEAVYSSEHGVLRSCLDESTVRLLAWLIRWGQRDQNWAPGTGRSDRIVGKSHMKIQITLDQVLFAIGQPPPPIVESTSPPKDNPVVKDPEVMPAPSMASTPIQTKRRFLGRSFSDVMAERLSIIADNGSHYESDTRTNSGIRQNSSCSLSAIVIDKDVPKTGFLKKDNFGSSANPSTHFADRKSASSSSFEHYEDETSGSNTINKDESAGTSRWSNTVSGQPCRIQTLIRKEPNDLILKTADFGEPVSSSLGKPSIGITGPATLEPPSDAREKQRPTLESVGSEILSREKGAFDGKVWLGQSSMKKTPAASRSNAEECAVPIAGLLDDTLDDVSTQGSLSLSNFEGDPPRLREGRDGSLIAIDKNVSQVPVILQQSKVPLLRLPTAEGLNRLHSREAGVQLIGHQSAIKVQPIDTTKCTPVVPPLLHLEPKRSVTVIDALKSKGEDRVAFAFRSHTEIASFLIRFNAANEKELVPVADENINKFIIPRLIDLERSDLARQPLKDHRHLPTSHTKYGIHRNLLRYDSAEEVLTTLREPVQFHDAGAGAAASLEIGQPNLASDEKSKETISSATSKSKTVAPSERRRKFAVPQRTLSIDRKFVDFDDKPYGSPALHPSMIDAGTSPFERLTPRSYCSVGVTTDAVKTVSSGCQVLERQVSDATTSPQERLPPQSFRNVGIATEVIRMSDASVNTSSPSLTAHALEPAPLKGREDQKRNAVFLAGSTPADRGNLTKVHAIVEQFSQSNFNEEDPFEINSNDVSTKNLELHRDTSKVNLPNSSTVLAKKEVKISEKIEELDKAANSIHGDAFDLKKLLDRIEQLDRDGFLTQDGVDIVVGQPTRNTLANSKAVAYSKDETEMGQTQDPPKKMSREEVLEWIEVQKRKRESVTRLQDSRKLSRTFSDPYRSPETQKHKTDDVQLQKRQKMGDSNYKVRRKEAVELMRELITDELTMVARSSAIAEPVITERLPKPSVRRQAAGWSSRNPAAGQSYVLARGGRGLIPFGRQLESVPGSPHKEAAHRTRPLVARANSCPSSPQRQRRSANKLAPTTYTERLRSLQSGKSAPRCAAAAEPSKTLGQTFTKAILTDPKYGQAPVTTFEADLCPSRSSSTDSLSSWNVPDDVKRILQCD